ncbi:MAG: 16S rRNA (cytidine(1402)-2'-O)-methyltransferase [Candidatus Paracaedibacteraceae bacterium]|nr:16S rRNA (cytidine(1402)-2'-O)-methyltransferase [Candidatus Paracaedibacteraceae bacterium]
MTLKPGLYCVATPIGNIKDITLRALEILQACDIIACEDTRVSMNLLTHYGISTKLWSYHDHNAEHIRPQILKAISNGQSVALISDAGTPLISDPGTKLVRACHEAGQYVTTLPGASAVPSALVLSGLMSHAFAFVGFFNAKNMQQWASFNGTLVFFESPRRVVETLELMKDSFHNRTVAVVREISKMFEEVQTGDFATVIEYYEQHPPKGEIVIVLSCTHADDVISDQTIDDALTQALQTLSIKDAAHMVAEAYKLQKKEVYKRALNLKKNDEI